MTAVGAISAVGSSMYTAGNETFSPAEAGAGHQEESNQYQPEESYVTVMRKNKHMLNPHEKALAKELERINKEIAGVQKKIEYDVHQPTGEIIVKIKDVETNEVIREIPPEKVLDIIDGLMEINGMIIDEKR